MVREGAGGGRGSLAGPSCALEGGRRCRGLMGTQGGFRRDTGNDVLPLEIIVLCSYVHGKSCVDGAVDRSWEDTHLEVVNSAALKPC